MKKTLIAVAAVAAFGLAHAENGFYLGGELGTASVKDQTGDTARALVNAVGGSARVTQDSSVSFGRIFGGYSFNPYVAGELGVAQSSNANMTANGTAGNGTAYTGTATLQVYGYDLSAIITPFKEGPTGLFFRAGVTSYTQKISATITGVNGSAAASQTTSGTGEMIGVGYDWKLGPGALRGELRLLQDVAGISSNNSTALTVGYAYKF